MSVFAGLNEVCVVVMSWRTWNMQVRLIVTQHLTMHGRSIVARQTGKA